MDKHGFPRRVDVSDELREIVLDFLISCMLEQPENIPEYGIEFFTKLNEKRKTTLVYDYVEIEKTFSEYTTRDECSEKEILVAEMGEQEEEYEEQSWVTDWHMEIGDYLTTEKLIQGVDMSVCEDATTTYTESISKKDEEKKESGPPSRKVSGLTEKYPKSKRVSGVSRHSTVVIDDTPVKTPTVSPTGTPTGSPRRSPTQTPAQGSPKAATPVGSFH